MLIKILTVLIFLAWLIYWRVEEKTSHKENPLTKKGMRFKYKVGELAMGLSFAVIIMQMFFLSFFPIAAHVLLVQMCGFLIVCLGFGIALRARKDIGNNWASGFEYQIKQKHTLVTQGIYSYIRHPIYLALGLYFIGMELVAGSWLFLFMFLTFIPAYMQGRREEKLLVSHFGQAYKDYTKKTKMFIPFVW